MRLYICNVSVCVCAINQALINRFLLASELNVSFLLAFFPFLPGRFEQPNGTDGFYFTNYERYNASPTTLNTHLFIILILSVSAQIYFYFFYICLRFVVVLYILKGAFDTLIAGYSFCLVIKNCVEQKTRVS